MDCRVVLEAAVPVYDVETPDEAVRIAIAKTGELLNPDLSYVEINARPQACSHCGEEHDPAFVAADEALVALELEMEVFNVEHEQHAERIALKEIGQRLSDIPLLIRAVTRSEEDVPDHPFEEDNSDRSSTSKSDDDALPDFDDLFE